MVLLLRICPTIPVYAGQYFGIVVWVYQVCNFYFINEIKFSFAYLKIISQGTLV
jgi:hypothetical protein